MAPTLRAGAKGPPKKGQKATRFGFTSAGVAVLRGRRAPMPHQLDFRLLGHLEPSFTSKNCSTDPGTPALGYLPKRPRAMRIGSL